MKTQIRKIVMSFGADLCGFANIDRFENTPVGYNPKDIYANCKSVISYAVALPKGLAKVNPRLIYGHYNSMSCQTAEFIAFQSAKKIESEFNCVVVPIPSDSPYEYWDKDNMEGKGLLSMKHAAVLAGLGSIGKSSLFLTKQFGNMVTLGAMLTDLDLASDELSENLCNDKCHKCMDVCPVTSINNGIVTQKMCRENTYGTTARGFDTVDCNKCRVSCPLNNAYIS